MMHYTRPSIAVIVTNHNYADYLPDALSSIQNQFLKPNEVIVVDDKSDTSCESIVKKYGYRYTETHFGNPLLARQHGFNSVRSDWVCFLDADDRLPKEYLATAALSITRDVDVIFSDLQYFGENNHRTKFPADIESKRLWQVNFLHVGCLVSSVAINLSGAFLGHPNRTDYHEDWFFWRKIIKYGFRYAKQESAYEARMHNKNRSSKIRDGGYLAERHYTSPLEVCHQFQNRSIDFLKWLNAIKRTSHDYIGMIRYTDDQQYDWTKLAIHLDHDVAAVHDTNYEFYDRTLFVGPVLNSYIYRTAQIPFNDKTEKVVYV